MDAVAVYESKWMRGREEVVLSKEMEGGVVAVSESNRSVMWVPRDKVFAPQSW